MLVDSKIFSKMSHCGCNYYPPNSEPRHFRILFIMIMELTKSYCQIVKKNARFPTLLVLHNYIGKSISTRNFGFETHIG